MLSSCWRKVHTCKCWLGHKGDAVLNVSCPLFEMYSLLHSFWAWLSNAQHRGDQTKEQLSTVWHDIGAWLLVFFCEAYSTWRTRPKNSCPLFDMNLVVLTLVFSVKLTAQWGPDQRTAVLCLTSAWWCSPVGLFCETGRTGAGQRSPTPQGRANQRAAESREGEVWQTGPITRQKVSHSPYRMSAWAIPEHALVLITRDSVATIMHGSIYMEDQILGVPENNGSGTRLQDPEWKIPVHQMHEVAGKKQSLATLHTPADKKNNTIFFRTRFSAWHVSTIMCFGA